MDIGIGPANLSYPPREDIPVVRGKYSIGVHQRCESVITETWKNKDTERSYLKILRENK